MSGTPANDLEAQMARLADEVARLNAHAFVRIHRSPARLMLWRFGSGLAFGLGTVLGGSILLSLLALAFSSIDFLPVIGEWAAEIAREMETARE